MKIKKINSKDKFERELFLISLKNIEEFSLEDLPQHSKYFTIFIANNGNEINIEKLFEVANKLIKSGLVYASAWGKDCEKIHDIFDEEIVYMENNSEIESDDDDIIMTTWHNNDTLEEALWFFLNCTYPTNKYYSKCKTSCVLNLGDSEVSDLIRTYLENQNLLEK